ncbi:MAG: hypothetical protein D6732_28775 [Methanobacteriota archaeon]|nr:MAG: hypothetical protein D6732_28775 [Euryarchaeota archaeon]
MKKRYAIGNWLVIGLIFILSIGCSDKSPIDITSYSPPLPNQGTVILRSDLKSGEDFSPGYHNGKIRSDRVILDWEAYRGSDFLCYRIYRNNTLIKTITDAGSVSYVDSGLVQNTYYNYNVTIINRSGLFKQDTIRIKTPLFLPPVNLNYQVIDSSTIKIHWQNRAESATHFRVFRRHSQEPDFRELGTTQDTFFVDNTVSNFQQYYYRVEAFNNYESTLPSTALSVFVNYQMLPPTLLSVQQLPHSRSVRLEWDDNSNAEDGFRIYRRPQNNPTFQMIATVPGNTTEYVDNDTLTSLRVDSTYFYAVTAYNQHEETELSNVRGITIVVSPIQNYVEIGSGIIDWGYPFYTWYHDARTQTIYLASEIGSPMTIRKIAYHVTSLPGQSMNNFVVRMKHTSISHYTSSSFDNSGYTVCLNTTLTVSDTGWVEIPLTTPFQYNGIDNLIIDVSFDNTSYTFEGNCSATNTFTNRSLYQRTDSGLGNPLFWSTGNLHTLIPNIRLYFSQ